MNSQNRLRTPSLPTLTRCAGIAVCDQYPESIRRINILPRQKSYTPQPSIITLPGHVLREPRDTSGTHVVIAWCCLRATQECESKRVALVTDTACTRVRGPRPWSCSQGVRLQQLQLLHRNSRQRIQARAAFLSKRVRASGISACLALQGMHARQGPLVLRRRDRARRLPGALQLLQPLAVSPVCVHLQGQSAAG